MDTGSSTSDLPVHTRVVKKPPFPHFGFIIGTISSLCYSLHVIFAKLLTIPPIEIGFLRHAFTFLALLPVILKGNPKNIDNLVGARELRIFLFIRGLAGTLTGVFFYLAVANLSPGNAVSLTFLDIVIVPIFARIFLKDKLSFIDGVFAIAALIGVVLIARPEFLFPTNSSGDAEDPIGIMYGLLAATTTSGGYLSMRKMGKQIYHLIPGLYLCTFGSLVNAILISMTGGFVFPCWSELPMVVCTVVSGLVGVITLNIALQIERPGTIAVLMTLQIITVYFVQVVFLHDVPNVLSLLGSGLIFSTSVCIAIRKIVTERKANAKKAKKEEKEI